MTELGEGWELARTGPGEASEPNGLDSLSWIPARVPGTVALALREAGEDWRAVTGGLDAYDWWYRTRFDAAAAGADEEVVLALGGIATVADVFLNGVRLLHSDSMFLAHHVDVGALLCDRNELAICCRALAPLLALRRRPRARWRTRLVDQGNLRFFRTMLLGRAPGFAPGPPVVGPWREVRLHRRRGVAADDVTLRAQLDGSDGVVSIRARLRALGEGGAPTSAILDVAGPEGSGGSARLSLHTVSDGGCECHGGLTVTNAHRWWAHTHGKPVRYVARLRTQGADGSETAHDLGRIGFRRLQFAGEFDRDGFQLVINDVPVFARGAVWTPGDLAAPEQPRTEIRSVLERVVAAGMNMLRLPGTACYESDMFYELCDELGILVWQDFMFANLDYPEQDEAFMDSVRSEVRQLLGRLAPRPSFSVACGGSEVAQQVAMLGLDKELAHGLLFGKVLPDLVVEAGMDAQYVPSAPWGGDLPFRPDRGIANYYGVGGYLRPLEDARRAEVKFAAECLAFANVPDEDTVEAVAGDAPLSVIDARWKAGVPRDVGTGWDFDDVRDHYLQQLFDVDPVRLRATDQERYLELSRFATGEVMAEVFGEWRRRASPCGGGLVLWLRDLVPGAGWGVLDHAAQPKVAYHHLRRALAPVAVWSTDEGLAGIAVHVANDGPQPLDATLRVALYRDFEVPVEEATAELRLDAHQAWSGNVESLVGRFLDAAWAYRFGPPAQDLVVLSLESEEEWGMRLLSQCFRLPAGRPVARESAGRLGLSGRLVDVGDGALSLTVSSMRFAYGVRVQVPGYVPQDDAFSVEPGGAREVLLLPREETGVEEPPGGRLTAVNLAGHVALELGRG